MLPNADLLCTIPCNCLCSMSCTHYKHCYVKHLWCEFSLSLNQARKAIDCPIFYPLPKTLLSHSIISIALEYLTSPSVCTSLHFLSMTSFKQSQTTCPVAAYMRWSAADKALMCLSNQSYFVKTSQNLGKYKYTHHALTTWVMLTEARTLRS